MKRSTGMVVALVLLGGAGIFITRLLLDNFALRVEVADLRAKQANPVVARAPSPAPAAAEGVPVADRTLLESSRQLMIDALSEASGDEKKMWLRVDPRDREASTFAGQIAAVFRDAGWDVKQLDTDGLRFKPGLLMLIGSEDDPPSYVTAAQKAIEEIGEPVTTGRGYLSYYENKTRESADWKGTKFLPGQTFVLLVGRKPDPADG